MKKRDNPFDIDKSEFQKIGYKLIDEIAEFYNKIDTRKVTTTNAPSTLKSKLFNENLPENGINPELLFDKIKQLLFDYSLFNGHPKFFGYITSSAAPIGALAELLAASVNSNVGAYILSPMATTIERQTIQWLSEFIGYNSDCGGILVSGGNMANFTGFLVARQQKANSELKSKGLKHLNKEMVLYCSKSTHTWVEKAAILFGHGLDCIRWIPVDNNNKMDIQQLNHCIDQDIKNGNHPFMVIGTAGDVSTGVVDDLHEINAVCKNHDLWFHIDGAYGAPAAVIPELKGLFSGLSEADSIAIDPHKWLYNPLEAGCILVKDSTHLTNTFSSHPEYYNFNDIEGEKSINYYEYGLQNSRGFRALKVWVLLQHIGKNNYINCIKEDIRLSKLLFELAEKHEELEAASCNLSITTLRYVPTLVNGISEAKYLNILNENILNALQIGGEVFLSNAIVNNTYLLRACIVNFRTSESDIYELIELIVKTGQELCDLNKNIIK